MLRNSNFALAVLIAAGACTTALGAPSNKQPDRPKKVYAHFMGCYSAGTGAIQYHARDGHATLGYSGGQTDPLKRNLEPWAINSTGGQYRTFGLAPYDKTLSLEESADLEIRRAMRIGVDGFTFDAWAGGENAKALFEAMFEICEEKKYPFELTLTIDAGCIEKPNGLMNGYVEQIKWLLDKHGKSPNLARRGGKPLILGYQSAWPWVEYLQQHVKLTDPKAHEAEVARLRVTPEGWKMVGEAYREMDRRIGQPIYWEFCMSAFYHGVPEDARKLLPPKPEAAAARIIAQDLPAVGDFLGGDKLADMAAAVVEEKAEFSQPILLQYENYGYFQAASSGTDWIRGAWQSARETPSTLLQYITWNDYHENTNLSPGYNTRYAYYDLTGYYIAWWKQGQPPAPDHDRVYIFSQKYTQGSKIYPFKALTRADNVIEVLTILTKPAKLRMPGRNVEWDAPARLSFKQVPLTAGPVVAELLRGGKVEVRLESPEPVSDHPFRQESGKVGCSTEFMKHWKADFGDAKPFVYSEYGDLDGDGLPNWFEMFWFGKFGDMSTATVADPKADPDGDGKSNLQEYLDQTDPTSAPPPSAPADPGKPQAKAGEKSLEELIDR